MKMILLGLLMLLLSGCGFQVVHCPLPGGVPIVPETKDQLEDRRAGDGRYSWWAGVQEYISKPELEERFQVAEAMDPPKVRLQTMDPEELRKICLERLGSVGKQMASHGPWMGFSYFDPEGTCVVVAPRPRTADDIVPFAAIGHELTHCYWGLWHPQENEFGMIIRPPTILDSDAMEAIRARWQAEHDG